MRPRSPPRSRPWNRPSRARSAVSSSGSRPRAGYAARAIRGRRGGARRLAEVAVRGVTDDSRRVRPGRRSSSAVPGEHVDGHDYALAALRGGRRRAASWSTRARRRPAAARRGAQPGRPRARRRLVVRRPDRDELGVVGITGHGRQDARPRSSPSPPSRRRGCRPASSAPSRRRSARPASRHPEHVTTPAAPGAPGSAARDGRGGRSRSRSSRRRRTGSRSTGSAASPTTSPIFTNLSHEHLELHGTFEAYRAAKLRCSSGSRAAPRNPRKTLGGRAGRGRHRQPRRPIGGAVRGGHARGGRPRAHVRHGRRTPTSAPTRVEEDARRLRVAYAAPRGRRARSSCGSPAGSTSTTRSRSSRSARPSTLDPNAVRAGLESVPGVPGRMERIDAGQPFGVVVDYAHIAGVAREGARPARADRRGPGRRADRRLRLGGRARHREAAADGPDRRASAAAWSSSTDEDPRGEDRDAIIDAIAARRRSGGQAPGRATCSLIADRRAAIEAAFERARPGDIVLLAGKGHERSIL